MADFNIPQLRNRRLSSLLADPSVMDNYQPTQPLSGLLDYSDPAVKAGPDAIGPPTIAGGLLSLDPTDYVGPQTLGKLAAGLKGLLAGGMVMGGIKSVGKSGPQAVKEVLEYAGEHRPPMKGSGAPLHDLTGGGNYYPDDIYGPMAAQYYGHFGGGDPMDRQTISLIQQMKNRPNAPVTMYRAVPKEPTIQDQLDLLEKQMAAYQRRGTLPGGAPTERSVWYNSAADQRDALRAALVGPQQPEKKMTINNGDWVTINRAYAKDHGEHTLNGQYKILSKKVPARKLFTNGDSIHEFGYDESGRIIPAALGVTTLGGLLGLEAIRRNQE